MCRPVLARMLLLRASWQIASAGTLGNTNPHLRALGEQAFNSFSLVLLIALFFLIPTNDPTTYGVAFVALALGGAYRMLRHAPAGWRGRRRDRLCEGVGPPVSPYPLQPWSDSWRPG